QNAKATAPFTVSGSANVNLKGDLDLPMALASISGNAAVFEQAAAATACFVVKDLNLSGNGLLDLGNALGNSLSVPTGPVSPGQTKSLCFWQGQGQALIHSFAAAGAGTVTAGAWLAANFPNLFGSLATANNAALVAAVDTASGLYGQALALGLNIYATTFGLGGQTLVQDALAFQYGLQVTLAGAGAATEDVGCDAAAFGLPAGQNPTLTLLQILQTLDNDYNPTERLFFSGDATLIGKATNVLQAVNG
ncbi:MAG TPA: hypothetical protein VGP68_01580, partial [Gemmataceae bacterium]|nr:hypothetical protein [Gemmataceae bacterium]